MIRFFTFLLLCSSLSVSAQFIKGQILINGSETPLPNASIYFDGMYKGGISDENGNFKLTPASSDKIPLIISAVGYYSTSIDNYTTSEFIKIYLEPKVYNLDPVVVTYDGMTREEKEAIFKSEFIGNSPNSRDCEILNMDDINLVYSRKNQNVQAFIEAPIILNNKALGFKISYYLDRFEASGKGVYFAGNYFFEHDSTLAGEELAAVEGRRRSAYLGSRMHFIRSLYDNTLANNGYRILNSQNAPVTYRNIIVNSEKSKNIRMRSKLAVIYRGERRSVSFLEKKKDFTYIDKSGFFDPTGITWSGYMASQRLGDLLPFNYQLPQKLD